MATVEAHPEYGELHTFDNGSIYYRDEDHSYWLAKEDGARGKRLASVSTLVGPYSGDPEFLMRWAATLTLEGVATLFKGERVPDTADALLERLVAQEMSFTHLRNQAADRGTLVHEHHEAMAGIRHFPSLDDASDRELAMVEAVTDWWGQRQPEVLQAEQVVFSSKHRYAGRFDLRCEIDARVGLCDLKTSGRIYPKYFVQLQGYECAAKECGIGGSDYQFILQVNEDGGWREILCDSDFIGTVDNKGQEKIYEVAPPGPEDFLRAVEIYRQSTELQKVA